MSDKYETCWREMEDFCSSQVGKESPQKDEEMTIDSHERRHRSRRKRGAKENGKRMSQ